MIYFEGLESIIECLYLEESINNRPNNCNIFVNPENIKYLMGKIVIINSCEYPEDNIKILVENGCHVISRIYVDIPGVEIRPYILKLSDRVYWNGRVMEKFADFSELIEEDLCTFDAKNYKLYFPKLYGITAENRVEDDYGNLSCLGWVLQQVGINVKSESDTIFTNIDVLKTGKQFINFSIL